MMTMSSKGGNGFGNGLIVGMIFGTVLTLLLTTKKGRQILRLLSEEGFDRVKKWENILDEVELDDSSESDEEFIDGTPSEEKKKGESKKVILANGKSDHSTTQRSVAASKRFFRGTIKR